MFIIKNRKYLLILITILQNVRCILCISFDVEYTQISLEKPRIEPTNASFNWNKVEVSKSKQRTFSCKTVSAFKPLCFLVQNK